MMTEFQGVQITGDSIELCRKLVWRVVCIPDCIEDQSFEENRLCSYLAKPIEYAHNADGCMMFTSSQTNSSSFMAYIEAVAKTNAGNKLNEAGHYSSALELYSEAIGLSPGNATHYCNRAKLLIMLKYYKSALVDARQSINIDENCESGYECLIKCCISLGNFVGANVAITKLNKINSNNDNCMRYDEQCQQLASIDMLVNQCIEKEDFEEAVSHIDAFLDIAVACLKFKCMKAECLMKLGHFNEAHCIFDSCINIDPLNVDVVYVAGLHSYYNGDLDECLKHLTETLKLNPNYDRAQTIQLVANHLKEEKEKGDDAFKAGNFNEAQNIYTEALQIDPQNINVNAMLYTLRAECHNHNENYEECSNDYITAIKMNKSTKNKAEQAFNETKITWKRLAEDKMNSSDEQYKQGQYSISMALCNEAIKLCPDNAAYYCKRSDCHFAIRNYKDALKDGEDAMILDEKSEQACECIVKCCLVLGEMDKINEFIMNDVIYKQYEEQFKQLRFSFELAMEHFKQKHFNEALLSINSALEIATASMKLKLLKVECLIKTKVIGQPRHIEDLKEISNWCKMFDPLSTDTAYIAGLYLYYVGDLIESLEYFDKVLKLDSDYTKARIPRHKAMYMKEKKEIGNEFYKAGEFWEAREMYNEALEIDLSNENMNVAFYFNRALTESKMLFFENAASDCTKALTLNPNYPKALLLRLKCRFYMKKFAECVTDIDAILKINTSYEIPQGTPDAIEEILKCLREFLTNTECKICFGTWELDGEHCLVALCCGHRFGKNCITQWIQNTSDSDIGGHCPVCRNAANIIDISNGSNEKHLLGNWINESEHLKCLNVV